MVITWYEILFRLFLAAVLGAAVGLERERKDFVAGVRTHMMVCLGSALLMLVSMFGFFDILGYGHNVRLDVARVAAQVVSGIGFIGAGTILFLRQKVVRGLTTAAGLWTVAGVGLAVGGGMYFAATAATVLALTILWGVQRFGSRFFARTKLDHFKLTFETEDDSVDIVQDLLAERGIFVQSFSIDRKRNSDTQIITIRSRGINKNELTSLIREFRESYRITSISWDS